MRVLFLSTSMSMGGADQQLLSAAREMRSRGQSSLQSPHDADSGGLVPMRCVFHMSYNWRGLLQR